MFASVTSVALVGVDPRPVRVEVHVGGATPSFSLVGLPDTAVREAKQRVQSAVVSSGFAFPNRRLTVNLSPADLPKAGSAYDLPIALGILAAAGLVPPAAAGVVALGELALDGAVRTARDGIGAAMVARECSSPCLLPPDGVAEASEVGGDVRGVRSLAHAVAVALGDDPGECATPVAPSFVNVGADLHEVRGQVLARRVLEIAASGGHHLLMVGPPGGGKTLLARCLPGLLPPLTVDTALEVGRIWAAAGHRRGVRRDPPFRAPHHRTSAAGLVGGGSRVARPGALSLAHEGVLFLDELGEFPPHLLDALRQPIESGTVEIGRAAGTVLFPSRVQVVAASNPCPCGHRGDTRTPCRCPAAAVNRYRRRMSGPFLDRFDLRIWVPRVPLTDLGGARPEGTAAVADRVADARRRAAEDQEGPLLSGSATDLLVEAGERVALTARGAHRVRRVARTIARMAGSATISDAHVAEAIALRGDL